MSSADTSVLVATRLALHQLAELVISPVRQRATGGRIALEARPGGFGTHTLPDGGWAGVTGIELVVVSPPDGERHASISSLRAAGEFCDDGSAELLSDELLEIDPASAERIADAFAGGTDALTGLLDVAEPGEDPSGIDLWPEHFDVAITLGDEAAGQRATYGVSPGDDDHPEPYAYVGPWTLPEGGSGWNATAFKGAEQPFTDGDAALAFFLERRAALRGG